MNIFAAFHVPAAKVTNSNDNRITLSTARYACEEAATLVHYVIALIEYTKLCQPLHLAKQRVARLKSDISEAEQKQLEKETEVFTSLERLLIIAELFNLFLRFNA